MRFAAKHIQHYPLHLKYVVTLPWEIKNLNCPHIFSRYGRKCKKTCILSAAILIPLHMQLCMLSVFMCFYENLVLITEYHVAC